mmetsp:Transcript_16443/g.31154  ORF Transcript_16443/g.31154 Transcript_16443/m.31154 type:complete len:494 (+) Transcript_16443:1452-2933(+)
MTYLCVMCVVIQTREKYHFQSMLSNRNLSESELRVGSDGRIHRRRIKKFPNGTIYDCEFVNGKPDGYGCLTTASGMKYTGSFHNGLFHGFAKITWANSANNTIRIFEGEFNHGKRHGIGTLEEKNGYRWEGYFECDKFHGPGTLRKANGEVLKGTWKNGKLHCEKGSISYANGDKYEGVIHYGKIHGGMGHFTYKCGGTYTGQFHLGIKHGIGTRHFYDKTKYCGEFDSGKLSGIGAITYKNELDQKIKYSGGWKDGLYHGEGELFFAGSSDVEFYKGGFKKGYFHNFGYLKYRNGTYYKGSFSYGVKDGEGKRIWKEGNCFEGEWRHGCMFHGCYFEPSKRSEYIGSFERDNKNGTGTETWRSPNDEDFRDTVFGWLHKKDEICKYNGDYSDGYFDGNGVFEASNGRQYSGGWRLGKPHGYGTMVLLRRCEYGDPSKMNIGVHDSLYRPLKYVGGWKDGKRHGRGKVIFLDGTSKEVNYDNGISIECDSSQQ